MLKGDRAAFPLDERAKYTGYFLLDGVLRDVGTFDPLSTRTLRTWEIGATVGTRYGPYVNNFIFVPSERAAGFETASAAILT